MSHRPTKKDWDNLRERAKKYYSIRVAMKQIPKERLKLIEILNGVAEP